MTLCSCIAKEATVALEAMSASLTVVHLEEGVIPSLKSDLKTLSGSSVNTVLATYKVTGGTLEETYELAPVGDTPQVALVLLLGTEYSTHGTSTFSRHKLLVFVQPCLACAARDVSPFLV